MHGLEHAISGQRRPYTWRRGVETSVLRTFKKSFTAWRCHEGGTEQRRIPGPGGPRKDGYRTACVQHVAERERARRPHERQCLVRGVRAPASPPGL